MWDVRRAGTEAALRWQVLAPQGPARRLGGVVFERLLVRGAASLLAPLGPESGSFSRAAAPAAIATISIWHFRETLPAEHLPPPPASRHVLPGRLARRRHRQPVTMSASNVVLPPGKPSASWTQQQQAAGAREKERERKRERAREREPGTQREKERDREPLLAAGIGGPMRHEQQASSRQQAARPPTSERPGAHTAWPGGTSDTWRVAPRGDVSAVSLVDIPTQ